MSMKPRTTMEQVLKDAAMGKRNLDKGVYMPTPAKIKAECEKIREQRSRLSRTKFSETQEEYEIPIVHDWRF